MRVEGEGEGEGGKDQHDIVSDAQCLNDVV